MPSFLKRGGLEIRWTSPCFSGRGIDQGRFAPGSPPRFDVRPTVPDHITLSNIDPPDRGCFEQHSRLGFPARAVIDIVVIAHPDPIQGNLPPEFSIDGFHHFPLLGSPGHIRLICHYNEEKSSLAEGLAHIHDPGENFQLPWISRGMRLAIRLEKGTVQHPIPIQKDRGPHPISPIPTSFPRPAIRGAKPRDARPGPGRTPRGELRCWN